MSPSSDRRRPAFTLVELLVSMALIVLILTAAITATSRMMTMTRRLQALQTMDSSAKTIFEKLSGEVKAMHPCAALWLSSDTASKSVEFVFMYAKRHPRDYYENKFQAGMNTTLGFTDLLWSRWQWSASTETLTTSTSRTARWTRILAGQGRNYWKIPSGSKMGTVTFDSGMLAEAGLPYYNSFLSVPKLVRETGTATSPLSPKDILNANAWQSGESTDIGDYDDLLLCARPLLYDCSDLCIELGNIDGTSKTADGTTSLTWGAPGSYVDARDQTGLGDRPGVVRIRFTLTDSKTHATRTYSFSCATPSIPTY
jgi:prepilin-type N-terminal cleavage/methylation domain-containing protein